MRGLNKHTHTNRARARAVKAEGRMKKRGSSNVRMNGERGRESPFCCAILNEEKQHFYRIINNELKFIIIFFFGAYINYKSLIISSKTERERE